MGNLTFRERTRTVGETDASGQTTRDETVYEYGAEIDGVFVRIGTITTGQLEDARVRADVENERGTGPAKPATRSRRRGGNGGDTAPNEDTPASAASAGDDAG